MCVTALALEETDLSLKSLLAFQKSGSLASDRILTMRAVNRAIEKVIFLLVKSNQLTSPKD